MSGTNNARMDALRQELLYVVFVMLPLDAGLDLFIAREKLQ
jgi:hypothetical protein